MSDIELLIKISEESYKNIKDQVDKRDYPDMQTGRAIKYGTLLPKGHGRLMILSEDKLKENQINLDFSCQKWISEVGLSNAAVAIIEAEISDEIVDIDRANVYTKDEVIAILTELQTEIKDTVKKKEELIDKKWTGLYYSDKIIQQKINDLKEIEEVINCDADAETKCKMISNILTDKPHYFDHRKM